MGGVAVSRRKTFGSEESHTFDVRVWDVLKSEREKIMSEKNTEELDQYSPCNSLTPSV